MKPNERAASVVTTKDVTPDMKRSLSAEELDFELEEYAAERRKRSRISQRFSKF